MIRRRLVQGTVVLVAAASAALSACGDDGGTDGGAGDTGLGGTGGSTGGSDGTGAMAGSDGTGATGGTGSGGDGSGGDGMGGDGMGGMGGDTSEPPTAEELVEAECPAATYTIVEGTTSEDQYSEVTIGDATAYVMYGGSDLINSDGATAGTAADLCILASDGTDTIRIRGTAGGSEGEYTGTVASVYIVSGTGPDLIEYEVTSLSNYGSDYRPPFTIADYDADLDVIRINASNALINTTIGTGGVQEISGFDATSTSAEYSSTIDYALVIDPSDGEIWLSQYNEGVQFNYLIGIVEGDALASADIEVVTNG